MTDDTAKIRLFVEAPLAAGAPVPLTREQAHYLFSVMRLGPGGRVALFNGRDGEWQAEVLEAGKRAGLLGCLSQSARQGLPPDLWLLFAPIKKARTDFIVEKATELGVRRIQPVFTRHTNSERLRPDRLQAHCVEAAEQCGGTYVPELADPAPLDRVLADWEPRRSLIFCDESRDARPLHAVAPSAPAALLIGPEGGFAADEAARLRGLPFVVPVSLGPRILRADTAAAAAIALWQARQGDWSGAGA
ncbi:16S rRNA (uracil(1498)-N(3))-methyltransferase (plasmid) [Paroceanicella profunda]|uniref:Ribosomal RNA small subunit methyltransferase E n=1 Tax=Paroceanicella profunda TaxID=2579971 RepID=A0A5B8G5E3_9RHOB|nr:16S rRNA (uracil(1498)-N(3))-methyltransferase [Paroceanicella profunda]QDL94183.1 16S rRNA (uracil(1498)-N(3))-methyltransferase [Paroceanicella profunda]